MQNIPSELSEGRRRRHRIGISRSTPTSGGKRVRPSGNSSAVARIYLQRKKLLPWALTLCRPLPK